MIAANAPAEDRPEPSPQAVPHVILGALAAGAGAIHLALVPAHAEEWLALGIAFAVLGWLQLLLALGLVARPSRRMLSAGIALGLAAVAAWGYTRVVDWPIGPEAGTREAAGFVDILCAGLEVAFVIGAALVVARPAVGARLRGRISAGLVAATVGLLVAGVTTAALAAPSTRQHGHSAEASDGHDHSTVAAVAAEAADGHDRSAVAVEAVEAADGHDHSAVAVEAAEGEITAGTPVPHDHSTAAVGGTGEAPAGHVHPECTEPVSSDQRAAAERLLTSTRAAVAPYQDLATAVTAGYRTITPPESRVVHYGNPVFMSDGATLDPTRPESLVYGFSEDHQHAYLLGAMYLMEDPTIAPPQPGGCETQWHNHTNLCLAPGVGMVGTVAADGTCPAGSANQATTQMLHVWAIDLPSGPFSELDGSTRQQVAAAVTAAVRDGSLHPSAAG